MDFRRIRETGVVNSPLRVLIVEDSDDDAALLALELRRGGLAPYFERVDSEETMRRALGSAPWDVVLSDYSMPRFTGLQALRVLQESKLDLPFLLVSGVAGEGQGVEA